MSPAPYRVIVVVDREFGEQLEAIPRGTPVWIIDSPANRVVVEKAWKEHPEPNHLKGITIFASSTNISPERSLLGQLDTIHLHHGVHSADPPYSELEVLGVSMTEEIQAELKALGFTAMCATEAGFLAVQPSSESMS